MFKVFRYNKNYFEVQPKDLFLEFYDKTTAQFFKLDEKIIEGISILKTLKNIKGVKLPLKYQKSM